MGRRWRMKLNVTSILILTEIFPSVHETCYLKTLILHLAITEILTRDHSLSNSLFHLTDDVRINTFKYHVLCADGKISIRVNLLYYRFFHRRPIQQLCFFPVGLSSLPGDRRNFNTLKTCWKCRINDKRPTGKKHTAVGWDEGGKISKIINQFWL